ncbi:MAG: ABC transporter permease [Phycisphaerae bacterium]
MPSNPILVKELLSTSRRGRFYLMRLAYLGLLALFVAVVWLTMVEGRISATVASDGTFVTRMADAGKKVIASIVWFQFVAAQVISIIILSNSISGELARRTFPVLLTTPISFYQIVLGKVLCGVFHVMVLLACSLPLLAIVRVFGGVPWGFVLSSVAISVCTTLLAATAAIYFSILFHKPYASALFAFAVIVGFHFLSVLLWPLILIIIIVTLWDIRWRRQAAQERRAARMSYPLRRPPPQSRFTVGRSLALTFIGLAAYCLTGTFSLTFSACVSPGISLALGTVAMLNPSYKLWSGAPWVNCVAMLLLSLAVMRRCAALLAGIESRRPLGEDTPSPQEDTVASAAALRRLAGFGRATSAGEMAARYGDPDPQERIQEERAVRRLRTAMPILENFEPPPTREVVRLGSPVLWRDTHSSLVHNPLLRFFMVFIPIGVGAIFYAGFMASGAYEHSDSQALVVMLAMGAALALAAFLSSSAIASEREHSTWPVLMTTPLSNWHIIAAKAGGVLLKTIPIWAFLYVHLVVFTLMLRIHPTAIFHLAMLATAVSVFVCGLGFYMGTRMRQTTAAALSTLGVCAALWVLLPVFVSPMGGRWLTSSRDAQSDMMLVCSLNPVMQAGVVVEGAPGAAMAGRPAGRLEYRLPHAMPLGGSSDWGQMTRFVLLTSALYGLAGAGLAYLAARRFRRHAF